MVKVSMNNFYGNGYYNPYQQSVMYPQSNPYQQQQQMNRPQVQQLTFVSGIEGAKAYIVPPNQTIYLKDSDSDLLWVKSADVQGKYYMQCFKLVEHNNTNGNKNNGNGNTDYLPMASFNAFKSDFEERLSKLSSQVENVLKQGSIARKNDNSGKGSVNRNE